MKTVLIGNGFNIQFSGRTYTSELILQRMKARARTGVYDSLFENTISGTEIIRVLDGLASEANRIIKGELDELVSEKEEISAINDFKKKYTYIKKPEEIMMEDWLLVAYLHSKEFADDEQTQNGIKVAFHRMFLDAIYNEGEIQKLYKTMGKTTKRYLQGFDKIFTVNYDNNIEKLTGQEVYHLHGSFLELQPSENDEYVFGYMYKQNNERALIKGFEHCYCNALLEYSGDKKIQQADLFHRMIVQFEDAKEKSRIYSEIPNDNEAFVSLAFEHPELKVAPEYYFDDFRNIEGELVIIGLSPNNDNHILECIEKNEKLTQVCFYCYSEQEMKAAEKMKDNRIQSANVKDLWKKLGVKQKQYNNYNLPIKMDNFTEIVNIFSDSGISEERLKSCINELPRYEIDRLCSLVEQEIEKRGLKNHTPKDEEDLLRDFGFISCLATKNGILPPVLMLLYIAYGKL